MSIRIIIFFFILMSSCKPYTPSSDPFLDLTQVEKDSLSEQYKNLSYYLLQPSKMHRLAKDTAIMLNPNNIENIQVLSYSYKKRGEHIEAMKILNDAVEKDIQKGSYDALQYRAWSLLYFYRDYHGTIKDVDLIHHMANSPYSTCWGEPCGLLKGQALYRIQEYEEALNTFDTVLTEEKKIGFNPDNNYLAHFYIGRCHHEKKDYYKALQSYQKVLDLDKNFTEALYQSGLIFLAQDQKEKAKEYLEKAHFWLKKGKKMGEPYFERFDEVFLYQVEDALSQTRTFKPK